MNINNLPILGKTLTKVLRATRQKDGVNQDIIYFSCSDGEEYEMYHEQSCCESVTIESIVGEIDGLVGTPILLAEERVETGSAKWDTCTWTFYTIATINGHVDIRWYGTSNGYYSERVNFKLVNKK